jgi:DNA polymerase-3 subunit alpha
MGIEVVGPNVNASGPEFSVADGKIYFALAAIKGCGGPAAEAILQERKKGGPFRDLFDFCERVDPAACNRSTIETLVKAGAFDCFGAKRSQLIAVIERALQSGAAKLKDKKSGQKNLFDLFDEPATNGQSAPVTLPDIPEFPDSERLAFEKEVLGFYLSAHPLETYRDSLTAFCTHTTAKGLKDVKHRDEVMMGGMISSIKLAHTRNPKPNQSSKYANFDLEDLDGTVRCIAWPDTYEKVAEQIVAENVVLIRGSVDKRNGDEANLIVNEVIPIAEASTRFTSGLRIHLEESKHSADSFSRLREILRGYPGPREVFVALRLDSGETVHIRSQRHRVEINDELRSRLDNLLGPHSYRLIAARPTMKNGASSHRGNRN